MESAATSDDHAQEAARSTRRNAALDSVPLPVAVLLTIQVVALHLVVSACPRRWLPACHTRCHDGDIMMCVAAAWFGFAYLGTEKELALTISWRQLGRGERERSSWLSYCYVGEDGRECWRCEGEDQGLKGKLEIK